MNDENMIRLETQEQLDLLELQSVSYIQGAKFHNDQREKLDVSTLKYLAYTAAMLTNLGTGLELKLKSLLVQTRDNWDHPRGHKLLNLFERLDVKIQDMLRDGFQRVHNEVGVRLQVRHPQHIAFEKLTAQSMQLMFNNQSPIVREIINPNRIIIELSEYLVEQPHGSREFYSRAPIVKIDKLWELLDKIAPPDARGRYMGIDQMRYRYETYSKHDIWCDLIIFIDPLIRVFDEIVVNER